MNLVVLIGRLGADPELRVLPDGTPVCTFSLAVDRPKADSEGKDVDWIDVTCFRKQAESVSEHLTKGRLVCVEGSLRERKWETEDGQKRRAHAVIARRVVFLPSGRKGVPDEVLVAEAEEV